MTAAERLPTTLSTRLSFAFATWFGLGFSKIAPGTVGSLGTLPLYFLLRQSSALNYWLVTALLTGLGCFAAHRVASHLRDDDPSLVVIDEVSGTLIALGLCGGTQLWLVALAFALFRLFDITKPWPIHRLEHVPPIGLGIMLDDVFAGLVAGALAWGVRLLVAWL